MSFTHGFVSLFTSGTLRPDLIESASELASGKACAIKTHHNDTELVRELRKQVRLVAYEIYTFHIMISLEFE